MTKCKKCKKFFKPKDKNKSKSGSKDKFVFVPDLIELDDSENSDIESDFAELSLSEDLFKD